MAKKWLKRIIKILPQGTDQDFDDIFNEHVELIYIFIARRIENQEDACEITLAVFLSVRPYIKKLETPKHLKRWLYVAARNACINYLKLRVSQKGRITYIDIQTELENIDVPDPDVDIIKNEIEYEYNIELIKQEIDKLGPRERTIFLLHHLQDKTIKEIAVQLNITPDTAKTYLREAIRKLRTGLEDKLFLLLFMIPSIQFLLS